MKGPVLVTVGLLLVADMWLDQLVLDLLEILLSVGAIHQLMHDYFYDRAPTGTWHDLADWRCCGQTSEGGCEYDPEAGVRS